MSRDSKKLKGIRRIPGGSWQVYVERKGQYRAQTLPANTDVGDLKLAREKLIGAILHDLKKPTEAPERTFAQDAAEYLDVMRPYANIEYRRYYIGRWVEVFGSRDRRTITALDITKQLAKWRGSGNQNGGAYSPASLNRMRTLLQHLYSTLDGKSAVNIVKDVKKQDERYNKKIRSVPLIDCLRIVKRLAPTSQARAVMRVLLYTGWTNQFIRDIHPDDVDWTHATVKLVARKKGRGMDEDIVPVVPRALLALRRLKRHGWLGHLGSMSGSSLWKAVTTAAARENAWRRAHNQKALPKMTPYVFRHSFGTWAAEHVKDDRTLKLMLRTNSIERYTRGANQARMEAARDTLAAALRPPRQKAPVEIRVEPLTARRALPPHVTR